MVAGGPVLVELPEDNGLALVELPAACSAPSSTLCVCCSLASCFSPSCRRPYVLLSASAATDALDASLLVTIVTHGVLEPAIVSVVVPSTTIALP